MGDDGNLMQDSAEFTTALWDTCYPLTRKWYTTAYSDLKSENEIERLASIQRGNCITYV